MPLLLQFDFGPLALDRAVLLQITEVRFLGFHHTHGTYACIALCTEAGVDSSLAAWHNGATLLRHCEECKALHKRVVARSLVPCFLVTKNEKRVKEFMFQPANS